MDCKVQMKDRVRPVKGSVRGTDGKETGTCPKCDTPGVMLSIVGKFVRKHVIADSEIPENNPKAPTLIAKGGKKVGTGLTEHNVDITDTGVRIGAPRAAEQVRATEIKGAAGTATVEVPRKVEGKGRTKSGKPRMTTKLVPVEATEAHVREALDYWRGRRVSTDSSRARQNEMVSSLSRLLEAVMGAQTVEFDTASRSLVVTGSVPLADQGKWSARRKDAAQNHRGPTLVKGRDAGTRKRDEDAPWDEVTDRRRDGTSRKRTTLEEPLGRERFDIKITHVPAPAPEVKPKPRLTASQRRNYRRRTAMRHALAGE